MIPAAPRSSAFLIGTSAASGTRTMQAVLSPATCRIVASSAASSGPCSPSTNNQSKPSPARISAVAALGSVTIVPSNVSPRFNRARKSCPIATPRPRAAILPHPRKRPGCRRRPAHQGKMRGNLEGDPMKRSLIGVAPLLVAAHAAHGASTIVAEVDTVYAQSEALYFDLHKNPELSSHETRTAAKLAAGLRELGYEVTTGVGGTGIVGVLRNGAGPVVMLRTELDALPVEEKTGLPYASTVRAKDDSGAEVGVMHACGHDVHMASWMGAARIMASSRNQWRGTLVLIGQPAEETVAGAARMLADGLFTRFPRPQYA